MVNKAKEVHANGPNITSTKVGYSEENISTQMVGWLRWALRGNTQTTAQLVWKYTLMIMF